MKTSIFALLLGSLLLLSLILLATSEEGAQTPMPFNIAPNTSNHSIGMGFCADDNWLYFNSTSGKYEEAFGTKERFPNCVYDITVKHNYSDKPNTSLLPDFSDMTIVDLVCLRAHCKQIVDLDKETGHVILVWENQSASP